MHPLRLRSRALPSLLITLSILAPTTLSHSSPQSPPLNPALNPTGHGSPTELTTRPSSGRERPINDLGLVRRGGT